MLNSPNISSRLFVRLLQTTLLRKSQRWESLLRHRLDSVLSLMEKGLLLLSSHIQPANLKTTIISLTSTMLSMWLKSIRLHPSIRYIKLSKKRIG
ncbi:hypothetical protein BCR33DRAFT_467663 [Rhizoclosmatium globosum]|uniref:Uncharacterized protein n=1 Tax=Rhizoclosmatium globosum TaxID=329046 RepID=A0A1Y2BRC0_9FUNG|nr:hypothetical protein BCR33DRAFT_467663 [Rhizoclosmatium globosum]|eukprot:ORY37299.1 hypothetical protein BCR33DRAFT_467663 [Rhizoclosmatium globosum]